MVWENQINRTARVHTEKRVATRVTVLEGPGDTSLYCNSTEDKRLQLGSKPLRQSQEPFGLSDSNVVPATTSHLFDHYAESTANNLAATSDDGSVAESEWDINWDNYIEVDEELFQHPERLNDMRFPKDPLA